MNLAEPRALGTDDEEIASLLATLQQTGQRLEKLTGGQIDAVTDGAGRMFLLGNTQNALREQEASRQAAILNALPAHIVLLDAQGLIVSVNEAWRQFATANHLQSPAFAVGVNYIEACDGARGENSAEAHQAAEGIRSVLAGANVFTLEYPCHSTKEQRWFLMTVAPLADGPPHGAVVMHQTITERKRAEIAFKELSQKTERRERILTTTLSNLNDFAYIYDRAGRFLFANQPLLALWGLTLEEVVGRDYFDLGYPADLARRLQQQIQEVIVTRTSITDETPYTSPSGNKGFYEHIFSPAFSADGTVEFVVGSTRNISERKRAEATIRESNLKFQQLTDNLTDVFWIRSPDFSELHYVSPAFERVWGRSVASLQANPKEWLDLVLPPDRERVIAAFAALNDHSPSLEIEYRIMRPDGEIRWVRVRAFQARNAEDQFVRHIGISTDITEHMRVSTALSNSLAEFRQLAESMPQIVWITSAEGKNTYISRQWVDYTGLALEESVGDGWNKPFHPEDQKRAWEAWQKATTSGGIYAVESRLRRADGVYRWWLVRGVAQRDTAGRIVKWFGTCTDIHDLKMAGLEISRANRALQQQQTELRVLIDLMPATIAFKGTDNVFRRVNKQFAESLGKRVEDVEGKASAKVFPQDAVSYDAEDLQVIRSGKPELGTVKGSRDRNGNEVWHQIDRVPVCGEAGGVVGLVVVAQDITERKHAADALRASEQRFKALFDQAAVGVAQIDAATGRSLQVNQRYIELTGRSREELTQGTVTEIVHPDDVARDQELARQVKTGALREFTVEKRYLRKDGSAIWAQVTVSAMWAPGDPPDYFIVVAQETTERKKLEEQVRQAQKMEAIGTLAGGIAHDFNNILAAINGHAELAQMVLGENPKVRGHLQAVLKASARAVTLVRQILTFSRQERIERRPIPLRPVVEEALMLLRATLPSTIEFDLAFASDAPPVLADANQIHQILMNLGTNAWHAMKDRPGRVQVKLEKCMVDATRASAQSRLRAGVYARVSVSDTGCGMDQATLRRIFEPFFTTKPVGEGTGLGLSVVHGIMESHDGAVTVYSQPGEGTVFHLYFPAQTGGAAPAAAADGAPVPHGRGERILFVDDEDTLGQLAQETLTAFGYEVETSTRAVAALELFRADPQRFALVITDQTMPEMTGITLAGELLKIRPELPIILTSGYSLSLTPERLKAAGIRRLLAKPTTLHSMGIAVHAALCAQPTG